MWLFAAVFFGIVSPLLIGDLEAQTVFTVTSAYDDADFNWGDGLCDSGTHGCTLRAAIEEANATPAIGVIRIEFDITSGPAEPDPSWRIPMGSALPAISRDSVTIDGETQVDAQCGDLLGGTPHTLRVELNGTLLTGSESGLTVESDDVVIKGLAIGGFPQYAVHISGESTVVECSYLGINADGSTPVPNTRGIFVGNRDSRIGGEATGAGNVISGNSNIAIWVMGEDAIVKGNLIGTESSGSTAVPNGTGMWVRGAGTTIGGTADRARNVISGNTGTGINVQPEAIDTEIAGNVIGTNRAGTTALGNNRGINVYGDNTTVGLVGAGNVICGSSFYGIITFSQATGTVIQANSIGISEAGTVIPNGYGVYVSGSDVLVGGAGIGAENVISGNDNYGVQITSTGSVDVVRNVISSNGWDGVRVPVYGGGWANLEQNAIYGNAELGINLCPDPTCDGVTSNDHGDADGVQNYPIVSPIYNDGSPTVLIDLSLNSTPSTPIRIELFRSPGPDPSGFGEGQTYIMELQVNTDASGDMTYTAPHGSDLFPVGSYITATATNPDGSTSEFSAATIVDGPSVELDAIVFLEGVYSGPGMSTTLNASGHLPLTQPFNVSPWAHDGAELVSSLTPSIVDWVLIRLFAGNPAIPPMTLVSSRAALLRNDGAIVDLDGVSSLSLYAPSANYHVAIYHRNHLPVISSESMVLSETPFEYDFTTGLARAYSDTGPPMKEVDDGLFGMYACDINADGFVQALDFDTYIAATTSGTVGYTPEDCTLDGNVQALDFNTYLENTLLGAESQVP